MEMTVVAGSVMMGLAVETVLDGMTGAVTVLCYRYSFLRCGNNFLFG